MPAADLARSSQPKQKDLAPGLPTAGRTNPGVLADLRPLRP
ncbi:MAG: hypothetical protein AVDCRST_MAG59-3201 [uncultured Thermomicrobiales bacterium]|uniref:Uncharacterized protein n=1 Tax=uncultured Thermomicrobiales bacterium TaxID=1645740 RepID=A0A6J4V2S6_9BACT|nr:MAG: hypothetical protein AVDCRST_MAG59-3201 [uncultured Thermomicrobiales bacterium]